MRFNRVTFNPLSILLGVHVGCNPVSGQRFMHIGLGPFVGLDFEFAPYVNDEAVKAIFRDNRAQDRADRAARPLNPETFPDNPTYG